MTFGQTNYLRANLCFTFDSSDRVILCACPSHNTFTLGPRTSPVHSPVVPNAIQQNVVGPNP